MNPSMTPGEILLEEYLNPMQISQNAMARAINVPPRAIDEIVLGKRSITPAISIRFGVFFGQSETFWHGLQVECDFRALAKQRQRLISCILPAGKIRPLYTAKALGEKSLIPKSRRSTPSRPDKKFALRPAKISAGAATGTSGGQRTPMGVR